MISAYSSLAKLAVENYIKKGEIISVPPNLPRELLEEQAGVFVTIENKNNLRGCIGTYLPTRQNIATEIIHNAIAAATEDYRFHPIEEGELPFLNYTVSILSRPEMVKKIEQPLPLTEKAFEKLGLNAKKYGLITQGESGRIGLLLPDLKGVNTVKEQFIITCQKGGINPDEEKVALYRFKTKKYDK